MKELQYSIVVLAVIGTWNLTLNLGLTTDILCADPRKETEPSRTDYIDSE